MAGRFDGGFARYGLPGLLLGVLIAWGPVSGVNRPRPRKPGGTTPRPVLGCTGARSVRRREVPIG